MTHIPHKFKVDGGYREDAADGIRGGQGRDDAQLRTSADTILVLVGLLAVVAVGFFAYTAIKAGREASRVEASK